jgi:hypothetical protein
VEYHAKVKESLIYNVHAKIVFMSEFLGLTGSLIKNKDFKVKEKEVEEVKNALR